MIELGKRRYLLFDGDCGVCTRSAEWVKARDRRGEFIVEPYQRFPDAELAAIGLSYEHCSYEAQAIDLEGRALGGAIAVNYVLLRRFPWNILVVIAYALPPLLLIEMAAYRLVARNRHRISRWLGLKACLLKQQPS
jgi:predicted DCC family thiol-disulfide oxidoreductase YuxK